MGRGLVVLAVFRKLGGLLLVSSSSTQQQTSRRLVRNRCSILREHVRETKHRVNILNPMALCENHARYCRILRTKHLRRGLLP